MPTEPLTDDELKKMRNASYLLPDPGGEVVRRLLDEVEALRADLAERQEQLTAALAADAEACAENERLRGIIDRAQRQTMMRNVQTILAEVDGG